MVCDLVELLVVLFHMCFVETMLQQDDRDISFVMRLSGCHS